VNANPRQIPRAFAARTSKEKWPRRCGSISNAACSNESPMAWRRLVFTGPSSHCATSYCMASARAVMSFFEPPRSERSVCAPNARDGSEVQGCAITTSSNEADVPHVISPPPAVPEATSSTLFASRLYGRCTDRGRIALPVGPRRHAPIAARRHSPVRGAVGEIVEDGVRDDGDLVDVAR
jgi:hypothetical protein